MPCDAWVPLRLALTGFQRAGELCHQTHQLRYILRRPGGEDLPADPLTCGIQPVRHVLALRRNGRLTDAAVLRVTATRDQLHRSQLGHLTADGRVIPAQAIGQLNHPDRPYPFDHHQQPEQRLVQRHACLLDQPFIVARAVHHTGEADHREVKRPQLGRIMCILHLLFHRHSIPFK